MDEKIEQPKPKIEQVPEIKEQGVEAVESLREEKIENKGLDAAVEEKRMPQIKRDDDGGDSGASETKIDSDISKQVQYYLTLAEEKGLKHSIAEAEKTKDPRFLDALHDAFAKNEKFKFFKKN
ncbi:MAG: hypothetical protein WC520_01050 [Candidatus Paceibacterota bacterium]